jgi:hypothetical protein
MPGIEMAVAESFREALWVEELAHELSGLTAFFDRWTLELSRGTAAIAEDVEIAREESLRLRALLAVLREVRLPELKRAPIELAVLFESALAEYSRASSNSLVRMSLSIAPGLVVNVSRSFGAEVLLPMLRAVAETVPVAGAVEVHGELSGDKVLCRVSGGHLETMPQIETRPWLTLDRPRSELAVALRIVRAHDGQLRWEKEGGRRLLVLSLTSSATGARSADTTRIGAGSV